MSSLEVNDRPSANARTVVVTGSSSGIGRAISELLLQRGDAVLGLARDHTKFAPDAHGYEAHVIDLADLDAAAAALDALAHQQLGVDAVVANAGYGHFGEIEQFSATQIRRAIDVNLTACLLLARSFVPVLKKHEHSDLIVVGSQSGQRGSRRGSLYCAAKFGLRGMAQALRDECARSGVRVTLISSGPVSTPFFDDLDFEPDAANDSALQPTDVARVVGQILDTPAHVVVDEVSMSPPHRSFRSKSRDS